MDTFLQKLINNNAAGRYACAGLDPLDEKIPPHLKKIHPVEIEAWRSFLYEHIRHSAPHAAAFKPNWAFFLALGHRGLALLEEVCHMVGNLAPDALLILDMKCGDIGDTNLGYVMFAFDVCGADALTVHPYMGSKAMEPFLTDPSRGAFVLCRTTNPGAEEIQNISLLESGYRAVKRVTLNLVQQEPSSFRAAVKRLLERVNMEMILRALCQEDEPAPMQVCDEVARVVAQRWNVNGNAGLVVPATKPEYIESARRFAPSVPLLIPGIGKQAGDLTQSVRAANGAPFVINQSSSYLYASNGEDFAEAGASVLKKMNDDIQAVLRSPS